MSRVLLISPYPATREVLKEMEVAGGPGQWQPVIPPQGDLEREAWRALRLCGVDLRPEQIPQRRRRQCSREQRADWWVDAVRACFDRIDPALRARVVAIGVSGQQHGFVPLDRSGSVLAPAKLWNDTSTSDECDEIMDAVGGAQRAIELAGNPILAGYTASKLPWTRKHRSQAYARLATILLPHDYINYWLTGELWMEHGDASGTGWLDVRNRRWSPEMLAASKRMQIRRGAPSPDSLWRQSSRDRAESVNRSRDRVIVVGGGPAGASTAFQLARLGVPVTVLERARFPRMKPCAECLSPQASRVLDDMGVLARLESSGAGLRGMTVRAPNGVWMTQSSPRSFAALFRSSQLSIRARTLGTEGTPARSAMRVADTLSSTSLRNEAGGKHTHAPARVLWCRRNIPNMCSLMKQPAAVGGSIDRRCRQPQPAAPLS